MIESPCLPLQAIAARVSGAPSVDFASSEGNFSCVRYIGPGGAGQYVKMVHNGIEYGDMQLISEAAHICRDIAGLSAEGVADLFTELNKGPVGSFLMEITATVHRKRDAQQMNSGAALVGPMLMLEHVGYASMAKLATSCYLPLARDRKSVV